MCKPCIHIHAQRPNRFTSLLVELKENMHWWKQIWAKNAELSEIASPTPPTKTKKTPSSACGTKREQLFPCPSTGGFDNKQRLVTRGCFLGGGGGCLHETLPQTKTGDPWLFSWGGGGVVYMKPFHKQRLVTRVLFWGGKNFAETARK